MGFRRNAALRSAGCELGREELKRGVCLGLLLAGEVDPVLVEEDPHLGRDLERLRGQASRREKIGPSTARSSSSIPSGAWSRYRARCSVV
jgi:hypothetical protein